MNKGRGKRGMKGRGGEKKIMEKKRKGEEKSRK